MGSTQEVCSFDNGAGALEPDEIDPTIHMDYKYTPFTEWQNHVTLYKVRQLFRKVYQRLFSRQGQGETLSELEISILDAAQDFEDHLGTLDCQADPVNCDIRRNNAGRKMMRAWAILEAQAAGVQNFNSVDEFIVAWEEAIVEHNPTENGKPLFAGYVWGNALTEPRISAARLLPGNGRGNTGSGSGRNGNGPNTNNGGNGRGNSRTGRGN